MPTYQYACTTADCGNEFELVQSFTDPTANECPVCGGPVRKVFSAVGVVFKGSGFYRTDSRDAKTASDRAKKHASTNGDSSSTSGQSSDKSSSEKSTSGESSSSSSSDGKSTSGDSGKNAPAAKSSDSSSKAAAPA
ncbi:MAG: FmdB family zinc ribbon protein [Jatrophihabitantaceae bacterium]